MSHPPNTQMFNGVLHVYDPQRGGWVPTHAPAYGAAPGMPEPLWPPAANARPDMNVQTFQSHAQRADVSWHEVSVADPRPLVPISSQGTIGMAFRTRVLRFIGGVAGAASTLSLQFDAPSAVYARCAGVRNATIAQALPAGVVSPLDLFDVEFKRNTNDVLDIDSGMGSALLGTADAPMYVGGHGWQFDNGNSLRVVVIPQAAGLVIDISVWYVSYPGPSNFTQGNP